MYLSKSVACGISALMRVTILFLVFFLIVSCTPGKSSKSSSENGFQIILSLPSPSFNIIKPEHQNPDCVHVAFFCAGGMEYGISLHGQPPRLNIPVL